MRTQSARFDNGNSVACELGFFARCNPASCASGRINGHGPHKTVLGMPISRQQIPKPRLNEDCKVAIVERQETLEQVAHKSSQHNLVEFRVTRSEDRHATRTA